MKRVLIVNKCGLFSALPTLDEYVKHDYSTEDKVLGIVEVSDQDAALIFQERLRIKVLLPELPKPIKGEQWLYIAVVNGRIVLPTRLANISNQQIPSINIQKRAESTSFFWGYFRRFWKVFK